MLKHIKLEIAKPIVFFLIFCILFLRVSNIFVNSGMYNFEMLATYDDEPAGSLDAVYIGSSNAFTFFQGPIAWEKYGMTVHMFSSDGQAMAFREGFIRYARKTQPDALYIITINGYGKSISKESMHWAFDFFPESVEKYQTISEMTSLSDYSWRQKMAIFLPFIQYHSRWNGLTQADFLHESNGLKGAFYSSSFLSGVQDVSENYYYSQEKAELDEDTLAYYDDFLDYCDEVNLNALFIIPPNCPGADMVKASNSIQSLIESRGYPVLNFLTKFGELGLDFRTDYYNAGHTNVHGSLKFTDYLADYLHENYSFEDKRGDPEYASWDEAYDKYKEIIAPSLSEEELNSLP